MRSSPLSGNGRGVSCAFALLLLSATATACNSTAGPNQPEGIAVVSGNDQFASPGSPVANPLTALVVDQSGAPFPGASVTWAVTGGGGTLTDSTSTSDADGHAMMTYTAGSTAGLATIVATVAQVWTASFTVHVVAPTSSISTKRAR
jgi:hypothetical protein